MHPYLIPTPEVSVRVIDERDKLLIMATDGVWDVMDNDEAMAIATSGKPQVSQCQCHATPTSTAWAQ